MMGRTHVMFGITSLWLLAPVSGLLESDALAPCIMIGGFGALLPDLDAPHSLLSSVSLGGIRPLVPLAGSTLR